MFRILAPLLLTLAPGLAAAATPHGAAGRNQAAGALLRIR